MIYKAMHRHELTEKEWTRIRPLLPRRSGPPSRRGDRNFVNAVLWIAKTGAPWRDLPRRFGNWKPVFNRFDNWSKGGKWESLFQELASNEVDVAILDASLVRAHQDSCGGRGGSKKTL
jgi:transposase